jgi:CTP synthase (UTP-ammonia lyase)
MRLAVLGDYDPTFPPHPATDAGLRHAIDAHAFAIDSNWVATDAIGDPRQSLASYDGLWVGPGSPYRSLDGAMAGIRYARERGLPVLGTCGGMQHLVLEFARSVAGYRHATSATYDPEASDLFITQLDCSLRGKTLPINLAPDSRTAGHCGATRIIEQYYCRFGLNPTYEPALQTAGLRYVGRDDDGGARVVELSDRPFYIGTLFVPQLTSSPSQPHPLIVAFLEAILNGPCDRADRVDVPGSHQRLRA